MGILFNILIVYPFRRWASRMNADWQERKDSGEKVFPLKPDTVVIVGLIIAVCIIMFAVAD